uniref:Uncharacterized protein n=1 Tax=Romanomermis culicivorax TaxID=13658 RepID=A0A915KLD7_ROMCU
EFTRVFLSCSVDVLELVLSGSNFSLESDKKQVLINLKKKGKLFSSVINLKLIIATLKFPGSSTVQSQRRVQLIDLHPNFTNDVVIKIIKTSTKKRFEYRQLLG